MTDRGLKQTDFLTDFFKWFTVDFILQNLDEENQKIFVQKVSSGDSGAIAFAQSLIVDFDERLVQALDKKIKEIFQREILNEKQGNF
jgi:hypothetical protein